MPEALSNIVNVLLIVVGFGLVIVVHELGHFLAARWAGIRVYAFAVGFGPAVCSWRKGLGFRRGSSDKEYRRLVAGAGGASPTMQDAAAKDEGFASGVLRGVSPTEYRLNWLPLGGYVKMLGQDDMDPSATSSAPDSYLSKPIWKRMIVIAAGVIMNLILAAILFIVVFTVGMREVAPVVGDVAKGLPADAAGFRPGDVVVSINGRVPDSFTDLQISSAMAARKSPVKVEVRRPGVDGTVMLTPVPTEGGAMRFMQIGVGPAAGDRMQDRPRRQEDMNDYQSVLERLGLSAVAPGSTLTAIDGQPVAPMVLADGKSVGVSVALFETLEASGGRPVSVTFAPPPGAGRDAAPVTAAIAPEPELQSGYTLIAGQRMTTPHLLGLTPLMEVAHTRSEAAKELLRPGDVFARVGQREWPDLATGIREIRASAGGEIDLVVLRDGRFVAVTAPVHRTTFIGFVPRSATGTAILAATPAMLSSAEEQDDHELRTAAHRLSPMILPGTRVAAVAGRPVSTFTELRSALVEATRNAASGSGDGSARVKLELALMPAPIGGGEAVASATEEQAMLLTPDEVRALHGLGWKAPVDLASIFMVAQVLVKGDGPVDALVKGLRKTHRSMMLTYLTFARLFQGTVKVQHLQGPVGIAHVGSRFAAEGPIYLLYFLALISVNLAVINFLPMPIVDGGLFVMLAIEGIMRKPVPVVIQNAVTMAGLVLIGTLFLVVTFNDITRLF